MKRAVLIVVALLVITTRVLPISDPDYHWHLATGRWVMAHHAVPAVDPFSHTAFGMPWKFVDWLADVFMYLLHRGGGDAAVQIAFALIGALAVLLASERASRLVSRASVPSLLASALGLATVVAFRTTPRPQTASFALLAGLLLLLDAARAERRRLYFVPPLIALWQNVHSSALLGVLAVFAYAIEAVRQKRDVRAWLATGVASVVALLCAVRPIDRLVAGFDHLGDPRVAELVPEWGTPFRAGVFGPWVVAAGALLVFAVVGARRSTFGPVASALGLSILGFASARMLPFAAIALLPLALEGLEVVAERVRHVAIPLALLAAVGFFLRVERPRTGLKEGVFPERAVAFLNEHHLEGNLFNEYTFGGYLMWTLGERSKVFVDGRSMALYGIDFVRQAALATDHQLVALLDRYEPPIIVVPPDRRMGFLQRKMGWALLYFDDVAAVIVRETGQPQPFAYRALTPGSWFEVGRLRDPVRLAAAQTELSRAQREAPDSSIVLVSAITVALAAKDFAKADALLADADRRFPGTQRVARAHLIRCIEAEDRTCACSHARHIQQEWPTNTYTAGVVHALACP